MKALTVRQPWASSIIHLGKDVENRTRRTNYRGQLYIHAAKTIDADGLLDATIQHAYRDAYPNGTQDNAVTMDANLGMVLGTVDVIGCHHADWCWDDGNYCSPWAQADAFHWHLANPRPLACPFPETGKLGIWNLLEGASA